MAAHDNFASRRRTHLRHRGGVCRGPMAHEDRAGRLAERLTRFALPQNHLACKHVLAERRMGHWSWMILQSAFANEYVILGLIGGHDFTFEFAFHRFRFLGRFSPGRCDSPRVEGVMRPIRFERLTRWGVGALMLLLIHGLGAPRSAWAGCSHLVVAKSDRLSSLGRLDPLIVVDRDASVSDELYGNPPAEPGPKRPRAARGLAARTEFRCPSRRPCRLLMAPTNGAP